MKKTAIALVSSCLVLGSSGAFATEAAKKVCDQVSQYSSSTNFPQQVDKYTVKEAYETKYDRAKGTCQITANYEFDADKFVHKLLDITDELDRKPEFVAIEFLDSDAGESVVPQMIKDEYAPKYEKWNQENVDVYIHAMMTNVRQTNLDEQYFDLHK